MCAEADAAVVGLCDFAEIHQQLRRTSVGGRYVRHILPMLNSWGNFYVMLSGEHTQLEMAEHRNVHPTWEAYVQSVATRQPSGNFKLLVLQSNGNNKTASTHSVCAYVCRYIVQERPTLVQWISLITGARFLSLSRWLSFALIPMPLIMPPTKNLLATQCYVFIGAASMLFGHRPLPLQLRSAHQLTTFTLLWQYIFASV